MNMMSNMLWRSLLRSVENNTLFMGSVLQILMDDGYLRVMSLSLSLSSIYLPCG